MSVQNGANTAKFEQMRDVIATETEARATDITRLEAKTAGNESGLKDVRQALTTETEARTTAVRELTAKAGDNAAGINEVRQAITTESEARAQAVDKVSAATRVAADKANSADEKAETAGDKADDALKASGQNTADITTLSQAVTTLDSSTASRFEEVSAQLAEQGGTVGSIKGGVQNTSIALIENTLAQVNQSMRMSVQYGDNKAGIQRVDNVMADASKAVAESTKALDSSAGGGSSNVTDLSRTLADFTQVAATRINSMNVSMNGQTAAITELYSAQVDTTDKLNAMYSIKVAVDANGRQYAAGMGIGVENTPGGMQSQVLFLADRFAVMAQAGGAVTLPFVIQNGQTIIRDTVIGDATITRAKLAETLSSVNYSPGKAGLSINFKTGTLENYGSDSSGAMKQTNTTISIKDTNRLRVQIGKLTGVF